jgi:hypothetical protein
MARLQLKDLPPAIRAQVLAKYKEELNPLNDTASENRKKDGKDGRDRRDGKNEKAKIVKAKKSISPYADILGARIDLEFPNRMTREFKPVDERRFRIDFAFVTEKVAIEFDGYRYHGLSTKGFKDGLQRQNILVKHGWLVLRYTLTDVRDNQEQIISDIHFALNKNH